MRYLILGLWIMLTPEVYSQEVKQEFEQRIKSAQMPEAALAYLESLEGTKKHLKFYSEQDGKRQSYEAKFKLAGSRYSVEFDREGSLEDLEILRTPKEMDAALNQVKQYLKTHYERHHIEKIQAQYKPMSGFNTKNPGLPDAWELIVATKDQKNKLEYFEMTFDAFGTHLKSRKVERRSYEFILF